MNSHKEHKEIKGGKAPRERRPTRLSFVIFAIFAANLLLFMSAGAITFGSCGCRKKTGTGGNPAPEKFADGTPGSIEGGPWGKDLAGSSFTAEFIYDYSTVTAIAPAPSDAAEPRYTIGEPWMNRFLRSPANIYPGYHYGRAVISVNGQPFSTLQREVFLGAERLVGGFFDVLIRAIGAKDVPVVFGLQWGSNGFYSTTVTPNSDDFIVTLPGLRAPGFGIYVPYIGAARPNCWVGVRITTIG